MPQFFYIHKPGGTPETLRYGGLPDTGPAPSVVNFPLRRTPGDATFRVAVIGDSQAYSNAEIGYFRDSAVADLLRHGSEIDLMLYVGDVVGDDLGLLHRLLEVGSAVGAPQYLVHGNHDFDFDATSDAHSSDSWRRLYGPQYYAFERGQALFVILDNVVFPGPNGPYNGIVDDTQMTWLRNLLEHTPRDRKIVFAHHIPFVSFVDSRTRRHQTDNLAEIHRLVEGRPALSLSGHTHTMENLAPGESFAGWAEATGVTTLPFRHMLAGAASGSWFHGDFDIFGVPMALQRTGEPKGVLLLDFNGALMMETYLGLGVGGEAPQWVDLNTPGFRSWFETLMAWRAEDRETRNPVPPLSINDLPDNRIVTPGDLTEGVYLTANVWAGSRETKVKVTTASSETYVMERTQQGSGEAPRIGAEWADPFAAKRQLSVARFAIQSRSGEPRNQGFEGFRGRSYGPSPPQPMRNVADRNMHLWRYRLPVDLKPGVHRVLVTSIDRHGRESNTPFVFEVRERRPPPRWRHELWQQ
ncbi:MAG: calcineurin-like phosphoesterase C-terminal domain-containing protein [Planctomycetota bacterium]